jgi:hypothetical protein
MSEVRCRMSEGEVGGRRAEVGGQRSENGAGGEGRDCGPHLSIFVSFSG